MVDDLHGPGVHATPACGPVSDNVGRKEINRRHSAVEQVGCGHLVRGNALGLQPVERFMRQPLAYYAVVELSASINPELVTDIMSASRLANVSRNVVHRDLM